MTLTPPCHFGPESAATAVDQILRDLKTPALRQPEQVEAALGVTVTGLLELCAGPPVPSYVILIGRTGKLTLVCR